MNVSIGYLWMYMNESMYECVCMGYLWMCMCESVYECMCMINLWMCMNWLSLNVYVMSFVWVYIWVELRLDIHEYNHVWIY